MQQALQEFWEVVSAGGPLMLVLFLLALGIYWLAIDTLRALFSDSYSSEAFNEMLTSETDCKLFELENVDVIRHRNSLLQVMIAAAPLLGLLGTVMGMLATFQGLNAGNGNTIDLIAAGISEAMITTETGLVIAIPASFMVVLINSRVQKVHDTLHKIQGSQLHAL